MLAAHNSCFSYAVIDAFVGVAVLYSSSYSDTDDQICQPYLIFYTTLEGETKNHP